MCCYRASKSPRLKGFWKEGNNRFLFVCSHMMYQGSGKELHKLSVDQGWKNPQTCTEPPHFCLLATQGSQLSQVQKRSGSKRACSTLICSFELCYSWVLLPSKKDTHWRYNKHFDQFSLNWIHFEWMATLCRAKMNGTVLRQAKLGTHKKLHLWLTMF
jgi:hypothetical protein